MIKKKVNYKCVDVYSEKFISSVQSYLVLSPGLPNGLMFDSNMNLKGSDIEYLLKKISTNKFTNFNLLRQYLETKMGANLSTAYFSIANSDGHKKWIRSYWDKKPTLMTMLGMNQFDAIIERRYG